MSQENTNNILYEGVKNIPYLDDHNNVFRSDGIFSPDIHKEYFGDKSNFEELNPPQRQRFFEKILADFFTRGINPNKIQDPSMIEKMEEDYEIFLKTSIGKYVPDYSKLESFSIEKGFLHLKVDGKNLVVNLVSAPVGNEDMRKTKIQSEIHKQTEVLKEKISTESYMGGSLFVTYEKLSDPSKEAIASAGTVGAATYAATGTAQVVSSAIEQGIRVAQEAITRVKRIGFRNQFGQVEFISPSKESSLNQSEKKGNHEKSILTELQNQGIMIDIPGKSFGRTSLLALSKTKLSIVNLSFESFLKESGQTDSRELRKSFSEWKSACIADVDSIETSYKTNPIKGRDMLSKFLLRGTGERSIMNISGRAIGAGMHWMFWPIFFRKYHENAQDSATLYASFAEVGLFTIGARIGAMTPGVFKPIASIVAGGAMVAGGEHFGGEIGLDKKWWKLLPDREDESYKNTGKDGKSILANIVTMGELYSLSDKTDTDIRIGKREGWDVRVPNWVNKIPGMENARDITLPHIDIMRKTIDLNTPPWEWISKTISRDKDTWNKEVTNYTETLIGDIYSFIEQYKKNEGIFRTSNIQRQRKPQENQEDAKIRIFEKRLESLFPNGGDPRSHNAGPKSQIIQYTTQLLRENNVNPEESIGFFVRSVIHTHMYLDGQTLVNRARNIQADRSDILSFDEKKNPSGGMLFEFSQEFSDPILQKYILEIFERIRSKKRLVDISNLDNLNSIKGIIEKSPNGYWKETPEFLGQKGKEWVNTKEWIMFQKLLDSKEVVKSPLLQMIFGEKISKGDIFYHLLNIMVENKRQEEFVKNIVGSGYANQWKLF